MTDWWRRAVLYQVYVRSFADSNGDGVGDLSGIRAKLPYLRELGVDGIWLTPFYSSPGADHGYDVSDYCDVDPQFGALADFDALVADARELGLRVIVDIVPNHCSIEHPWWREHPDWFVWRDEPNNWQSAFGGPAWTFDERRGQYYLHLFAPEQPDLDWHNPEVQLAFEEVLRFWLDRGVDGFRVDVAHALFKDPSFADEPEFEGVLQFADDRTAINQPEVHALYRRWRELVGDRILVGEIVLHDQARVAEYLRPDEMHLAFNFALLKEEWDAERLRATIDRTLDAFREVGATATWVLENHDVTRLPTRIGAGRAAAAALLLLALPGTAFVYAGQELGLEEVDLPDEVRQDPIFFRPGPRKGRDGCRVPIPWEPEPTGFGFTTGTPWLPVPASWAEKAVGARPPILDLYRRALELRREFAGAPFAWLESAAGTLAFRRGDVVCVIGVSADPELPAGELLLQAGGAAWLRV
jgi:alpha-glucosidase